MCQGLPGSGKSTWAELQRLAHFVPYKDLTHDSLRVYIVNKDSIRQELCGAWSREQEKEVIKIRDARIYRALMSDYPNVLVISDDTNFARRHKERLSEMAQKCGAAFQVK